LVDGGGEVIRTLESGLLVTYGDFLVYFAVFRVEEVGDLYLLFDESGGCLDSRVLCWLVRFFT